MGRSEFEFLSGGNGKSKANEYRVEISVKQILCGMKINVGASVMNKECLEWYREWANTH
jgi:acetoacetyl-CoA synthetase